jgi:hypothetical protein
MMKVVDEREVATFNLVPLTLEEQRCLTKRLEALMGTSRRSKKVLDRSPTLKTDQRTMGACSCSSTLTAPQHCLPAVFSPQPLAPRSKSYQFDALCSSCV